MQADTFVGQVIAVLSRRASAFEWDSVESGAVPSRRLRDVLSRRRHARIIRADAVRPEGGTGPRRLLWWGASLVAAVSACAAFLVQLQSGEHLSPWTSTSIKVSAVTATVVALLLPAAQTWLKVRTREDAQELAKQAVTNYQLALRSILLPLTDIFDRIITAPNETAQKAAIEAAKQAVVNSVVQLTNVPRARSCYFDYERHGEEKKLVCRIYAGRDAKPRTEFSSADPAHLEVFKLLENRQLIRRENIALDDPSGFALDRHHTYKTYISVPVATSAEIFGLLTLDALHPGELLRQHEKELLLLAQLLGIALAAHSTSRSRTKDTTRPEDGV